jgi:ribose/xylose/arabinose/galactoside ABC-type transport system permease subunit
MGRVGGTPTRSTSVDHESQAPDTPAGRRPVDRSLRRALLGRAAGAFSSGGLGGLVVVLAAVVAFFSAQSENFGTYTNVVNILSTVSVLLIVSLGQTLTVTSGGFDLSVSGVVSLGAVVYAKLTGSGMTPMVAILIVLAIGTFIGLVNALIIAGLRVNPLITTLGMMSVTTGLAFTVANGVTVSMPESAGALGSDGPWSVPWCVYLAVVLALFAHVLLRHSSLGRRIYVVGGNEEAARLAGIRVGGVLASVYGISGACAAMAGVVYASQLLAASGQIGAETALSSIAAVVLGGASLSGGVGRISGTVLGVLLLGTVADGLSVMRISAFYQQIVTGAILLIAVVYGNLPELLRDRRGRWVRWPGLSKLNQKEEL